MQFNGVVDNTTRCRVIPETDMAGNQTYVPRYSVTSGLGGRHIYFRYKATSGDIVDNTVEQLDLENMGIAVGSLLICALELEI